MSTKVKATKVPVMKENQLYVDWKKELQIWEGTNTTLGVEPKVLAGTLFESLEGTAWQTVLSELTVPQIITEDGVKNILKTLDEFFLGNETHNAFKAMDDLMTYRRKSDTSMEKFIIEFQLKVNKVKSTGTVLPDGVLGYALLNSANLPTDKQDMCKATCDTLTYKNVKAQLEKIGFGKNKSDTGKFSVDNASAAISDIKVENCFYGNIPTNREYNEDMGNSSDDDLNGERVFFSGRQNNFSSDKKFKMNPTDSFGHVRACTCCKCVYHWLVDCPYAPTSVKNNIMSKRRHNNQNNSRSSYSNNSYGQSNSYYPNSSNSQSNSQYSNRSNHGQSYKPL